MNRETCVDCEKAMIKEMSGDWESFVEGNIAHIKEDYICIKCFVRILKRLIK